MEWKGDFVWLLAEQLTMCNFVAGSSKYCLRMDKEIKITYLQTPHPYNERKRRRPPKTTLDIF